MTIYIGAVAWHVWISNKNIHSDLETHNGLCVCDDANILISADCADDRKPEVAFHEMIHGVFFMCGYEASVAKFIENTDIDEEEREEARVAALSHILWAALTSSEFLKFPPIPEEAARLVTKTG